MFVRLSLFFVPLIAVLSQPVTFQNVIIQYQAEDYEEFITEINSAKNLAEELGDGISRITVVGGDAIPIVYAGAFANLTSLKILQIRQKGLEEIQAGAFKNIPKLEILRLSGNKLQNIEHGVFNNLNLVYLNLDHNLIKKIAASAFEGLQKLQVLDLGNNKINIFVPQWLKNKPNLSFVSVVYNEIEELPDGALADYHNDIDFGNNKIKNVSRGIFGSKERKIGQLSLADNYIEKWQEGFVQDVQIRVLDISRNNLECLDGDLGHYFVARQTKIDGNPWKCECLLKISSWILMQKVHVNVGSKSCNSTNE